MKKLLQLRVLCVIMLALFGISGFAQTATVTIGDYANANDWASGTQYKTIDISDNSIVVATAKVSGNSISNTGKYYTNGNDWRIYQTENPTLTIAGENGYTISSVKITYNVSNYGTLVYNGSNIATDVKTAVTNNSIAFTVGNTSTKNNGQVKITNIEVAYTAPVGAITKPTFDPEGGIVAAGTTVTVTADNDVYVATEAELDKANPTAEEIVAANHKVNSITVDATNTYFAVATDGQKYSGIATATFTVLAHAGTEADPYNVADAILVANANGTSSDVNVYVTGYVANIKSNTEMYITDAADGEGDQLEVYNASNPNNYEVGEGDKIVVCAPLCMYKTTPETKGGEIVSMSSRPDCGLEWSEETATYVVGTSNISDLPTLVNPNNLTVTYSSSDEAVATIAADGTVTIKADGITIISAEFAGNTSFKGGVAEYILQVQDPNVTSYTCVIDLSTQTLGYGKDKDVTWTAENGKTFITSATVSGNSTYPTLSSQNNLRLYKTSNNIVTVNAPAGFYFAEFNSVTNSGSKVNIPANVVFTVGATSETVTKTGEGNISYTFDNPTNVFSFNVNTDENGNNSDFSTITLVIKAYTDGVELYDGNVYGNTVEAACGTIEYIRDFASTNWQPWYAPFAADASEFEQVIEFTGAVAATNSLKFTTVTGTLDANKPYIVKPKAADTVIIEAVDGNLAAATENSVEYNGYTLTGIYNEKTDMASTNAYAIANDGNFHPAVSDDVVLKPFRLYLTVPAAKAGAPVRIVIDGNDVSGIEDVIMTVDGEGNVYDLQGIPVERPQHGIFIQNGKKVYVK